MLRLKAGTFKFKSYGGAWYKAMKVFFEKYILISGFLAFSEVSALEKVLSKSLPDQFR